MTTEPAVLAVLTDGADVVVTFAQLGKQVTDFFWRVLQVGIERNDRLTTGLREASHDGHVLTVVAVEQDHAGDVRTLAVLVRQNQRRTIPTAIVDEDDFIAGVQGIECRVKAVEQRL